jgi:hypothetical protein
VGLLTVDNNIIALGVSVLTRSLTSSKGTLQGITLIGIIAIITRFDARNVPRKRSFGTVTDIKPLCLVQQKLTPCVQWMSGLSSVITSGEYKIVQ